MKKTLWFLLFLYLVAFPFGRFNRLPTSVLSDEVSVYATDVLAGIIGVIWLFSLARRGLARGKLFWSVASFFICAFFSLLLAALNLTARDALISSLYLVRLISYFLFAGAIWDLLTTKKEQSLVLNSLICVGSAVAILGLVQYFIYPDLRALLIFGWDEHVNRVVGTFLDPNFTSIILVFTLILILGSHLRGGIIPTPRKWMWALWLVVFSAFILTYSRGGYLAFIAGVIVYSLILKNLRIVIFGVVLLLAGIYFLPKQTSEGTKLERITSINLRIENWQEGMALFSEHPVFGVGFNTLRYTREPQLEKYGPSHAGSGIDSSLIFILATTGVVGFIAFLGLVVNIFRVVWLSEGGGREIIIPILTALFVHSLFVNSLFYPWVLGWLALLLAPALRTGKN